MATDAGELVVKLQADMGDLQDGLKQAASALGNFGSSTVAMGTAIGIGFTELAEKAITFGIESVKAFGEQEIAVTRLTRIVGSDATQAFVDYAEKVQSTTTFTNESVLALEAQLSAYGVLPGSIEASTQAVLDYAAATGKDLPEAGAILGQAMQGQSRELKKYGLELSTTADRSTNLSDTTKFLEQRFGGMAETLRGTTIGEVQNFLNRLDDLKKKIGEELVTSIKFWTPFAESFISKLEQMTGATKNDLSVRDMQIKQLTEEQSILKLALQGYSEYYNSAVKITGAATDQNKAFRDRMVSITDLIKNLKTQETEEQKVGTAATKSANLQTGATEQVIDAIKKLKDQILSQEQVIAHIDEVTKLSTQLKIAQSTVELAQLSADQQKITAITDIETQKRVLTAQNSYEANASFSDQLMVKTEEDLDKSTADWVNLSETMLSSFADSTAKMIVEGGRFSDVMKKIWQQLAEAIIAQILRMIAEWLVWMALTGGGGGALGFMQEGGMINEPSMIKGLRSGKVHIAGEAGPEMVVPTGSGSGGTNMAMPTASQASMGGGAGGGGVTINISGQFLEGSQAKWQRMLRDVIVPEVRRATMILPSGPFNRVRGAS